MVVLYRSVQRGGGLPETGASPIVRSWSRNPKFDTRLPVSKAGGRSLAKGKASALSSLWLLPYRHLLERGCLARWGTAVPKAVHQGLAPCGRGSCPRSAPRKPLPLLILTVIDTGPRAPLLRRAAPQLHYKNGCQWNPAKSLLRESGRLFGNYTKGGGGP